MSEAVIAARVTEALERLGVDYERIAIDPADADTTAFCARYGYPLDHSGNTILVATRKEPKRFAACVVRADRRLDVNHAVRRRMGVSRLSFAKAEETIALTGMEIGGVTVFALPPELPIYVDERVMELPWVILGGGDRATKIRVAPEALRRIPAAEIVGDLAIDAPADG